MKSVIVRLLSLAVVAGTLSACSGSVSVGTDPYKQAWYDVYGVKCASGQPTAGCNFYANGSKIIDSEDPYFSSSNVLYYDTWYYTDSYGTRRAYLGYAWLSNTGILYDNYGSALNETDDSSQSADVIAQAASQEKKVATAVGKAFAEKYALNEDKGIVIAKTLQDWAQLPRDRARTDADVMDYSKRLYGIDASKAKSAITEALATQSQKPLEDLNADVAAYWGSSPETSKQILKGFYKEQVAAYGIK